MDGMSDSSAGSSKKPRSRRLGDIDLLNDFVLRLKRGQLASGHGMAMQSIDLLRALLSSKRFSTVDELIDYLHHVGAVLTAARPQEQVTVNIVRRILRIVREEGKGLVHEVEREEEKERSAGASAAPSTTASPSASPPTRAQSSSPPPPSVHLKRSFSTVNIDVSLSLQTLLDQPSSSSTSLPSLSDLSSSSPTPLSLSSSTSSPSLPPHTPTTSTTPSSRPTPRSRPDPRESEEARQGREWLNSRLKPRVMEEIAELMTELDLSEGNIAAQATEHIYANETILTYGCSATVLAFLKEAARFRRFEVMVLETAPSYAGHVQAMRLATAPYPIDTTVLTDSAVYAIMPAVNKVFIGCHAVMANGALIVESGGFNVALAAQQHSVPLVVLTGLHQLSPLYPHHSALHNIHQSPAQLLAYDTGTAAHASVRVENPLYEEVSADLVSLLITNLGGHNPSYIYRLLSDCYHTMDTVFTVKPQEGGEAGAQGRGEGGGKGPGGLAGVREDGVGGKEKEKSKGGKSKDKEKRKSGARTAIEEE